MICPTPLNLIDPRYNDPKTRLNVPCGKCGACESNRRNEWTFRLIWEERASVSSHFLTLTYTDENLPTTQHGEITLKKKDLQDFFKRLRKHDTKHHTTQIRYYAVGEYGTKTQRPHYHVILFNAHNNTINNLDQIWQLGITHVGTTTQGSIHYVTKYHVNYRTKEKDESNRISEFALMSKRPAIGHNYIQQNYEYHKENGFTTVKNNGYDQKIPRYFRNKIFDKIEKTRQSHASERQMEINLKREVDRLNKLGITKAHAYIFESQIIEAQKIKNKADDKDRF